MQDFFYFCVMESSFLFLNFLGTGEFVLIAFVFLLLFGPDKIPGLARNLGKGIRRIKDASNDIKYEIHESSKLGFIIPWVLKLRMILRNF